MNTAFDLEVRHHCHEARVVSDLFHVVAKYGREVIDRVRVDEANRLRHAKSSNKRNGCWCATLTTSSAKVSSCI